MRVSVRRRRAGLLGAAIATVGAGVCVHFLLDGDVADFVGDALYAVLVYTVVAFIAARLNPTSVGVVAFVVCAAIELFQLTGIPHDLGAQFPPVALILGSGFSALDLAAYAVGVAVGAALDLAVTARSRRRING